MTGLFSPVDIRGHRARNRFVLPAMQRGWTRQNGASAPLIDFYRRCAAGGVSVVITEALAIDHPSATWQDGGYLIERTAPAWKAAVDAVQGEGSAILLQLWHEGAIRKQGQGGPHPDYPTLSPSGLFKGDGESGRAATIEELAELRDSYVRAAVLAERLGADGVEVHSAHGYLLDQFLWAETNRRTDGYGGDIAGRSRFAAEIVAAIRAATREDFIISFRFSQWKEVDYAASIVDSPDELAVLTGAIRAAGADMIHASARRFFKPEWAPSPLGIAGWAKSTTDALVIANGSVGLNIDVMDTFFSGDALEGTAAQSLDELDRRFQNKEFDLVSVGRSLIGDQQWVGKVQRGQFDQITTFDRSMLTELGDMWDPGVIGEAHGQEKALGV